MIEKIKDEMITPISRLTPSRELEELQGLMPIDPEDKKRLIEDIKKNGVRDPIKVYSDEEGNLYILGGYNRWSIAKECGTKTVTVQIYKGTKQEYKDLVINDNLNRRHLTREQKENLIKYFIKKDPAQSNRAIAKKAKVDDKTVAKKRKELEAGAEIPHVKKVKGQDGKEYKKPEKKAVKETNIKRVEKHILSLEAEEIKTISVALTKLAKNEKGKLKTEIENLRKKIIGYLR